MYISIMGNLLFQSTTIGVTLALALSAWIGVGSNFNKTLDPPLPGPVYNCSFLEAGYSRGQNLTSVAGFGEGNFDMLSSYVSNTSTESPGSDRSVHVIVYLFAVIYLFVCSSSPLNCYLIICKSITTRNGIIVLF